MQPMLGCMLLKISIDIVPWKTDSKPLSKLHTGAQCQIHTPVLVKSLLSPFSVQMIFRCLKSTAGLRRQTIQSELDILSWNVHQTLQQLNITAFLDDIVAIKKRMFDTPFATIGSLYFKGDIATDLQSKLYTSGTSEETNDTDIYCIGPIADYGFWHGRRPTLDLDRYPWNDPTQYLLATVQKELQWTENFWKAYRMLPLQSRYMVVSPYLLPKDPENVSNRPTLHHPNFTFANVIVDPDTFRITSIIDWQHAVIVPLSLIAGHPNMFQHPPLARLENLEPRTQPLGYVEMNPQEQAEIEYHLQISQPPILSAVNKLHLGALRDPLVFLRQQLVEYSGCQWWGNLTTLRGALMYLNDT
ncbi:serine/threonine protein kinase [Penicillium fimorum]|uniref:Serine/threonine protein kinase n=1 Tax=Penicillium fimorum TaxID=1882269 RepID=A0A9W9XRL7_9EURO|nr:serine/threonine protein kinase [Penicillium fimorum]